MKTESITRAQQSPAADDSWKSLTILPARIYDDSTLHAALSGGLTELRKKLLQEGKDSRATVTRLLRSSTQRFIDSLHSIESSLEKLHEKNKDVVELLLKAELFNGITEQNLAYSMGQGGVAFDIPTSWKEEVLEQTEDAAASTRLLQQLVPIVRQWEAALLASHKGSVVGLLKSHLRSAAATTQDEYRQLIDPALKQLCEFADSARAWDPSSVYGLRAVALKLAECASETNVALSQVTNTALWSLAKASVRQLRTEANDFSNQLSELDYECIHSLAIQKLTLQQAQNTARALSKEMDDRFMRVGVQVEKISEPPIMLAAMDFHLSQENLHSFEIIAQRFIKGTRAQRALPPGDLERVLAQYLTDCEAHEVTERAARLRALLTRATSVGVGEALREERATLAKHEAESEESTEAKAEVVAIARFVENEDLQQQLYSELSGGELGVSLIAADVEEQLSNIVGTQIALELLRENPRLVVEALTQPEQFQRYVKALSAITPVINATRNEGTYSPRFFSSAEAIQALIDSEGAELGREYAHPEDEIIRHLESAGVSSPPLAYAILKFGFLGSKDQRAGAFIPESARYRSLYSGIVGPIPSKGRIRELEAELEQLGMITFGSKRSAAINTTNKLQKDLHVALWKMQTGEKAALSLAVRLDR